MTCASTPRRWGGFPPLTLAIPPLVEADDLRLHWLPNPLRPPVAVT